MCSKDTKRYIEQNYVIQILMCLHLTSPKFIFHGCLSALYHKGGGGTMTAHSFEFETSWNNKFV